jgi:hypothetical protein
MPSHASVDQLRGEGGEMLAMWVLFFCIRCVAVLHHVTNSWVPQRLLQFSICAAGCKETAPAVQLPEQSCPKGFRTLA